MRDWHQVEFERRGEAEGRYGDALVAILGQRWRDYPSYSGEFGCPACFCWSRDRGDHFDGCAWLLAWNAVFSEVA